MPSIPKIPVRQTTILALVSIVIIFLIFKTIINIDDFFSVVRSVNWFYFFLAFATVPPIIISNVFKWHLIIRATGFSISFKKIFNIVITSISLGILPGRIGDFARSYPLRNTIPISQSIGTIILEKVLDISVLLLFSGVGLFVLGYPLAAASLTMIGLGAIPMLKVSGTIMRKILPQSSLTDKLYSALSVLNKIKGGKVFFLIAAGSSFINATLSMFQIYWLFKAVGTLVPLSAIFSYQPLSVFAGLLPITLAGAGTRDSAIIYFFKDFATPEQSLAVGILYGMQSYWAIALLGLPLLYYFFKEER